MIEFYQNRKKNGKWKMENLEIFLVQCTVKLLETAVNAIKP